MELTITLENLDESIRQLREFAHKVERFPMEVAYEAAENIRYPESSPYVVHMDGRNRIEVQGEGIAFQEFGAGFLAEPWSGYGFSTAPGDWSADHARTYQNYQGDALGYRYNQEPQMKVQNEAERLGRETETKARLFFDN